ncbi:MAG: hypothetical protein ACP5I6_03635 [Caldisphaera sp.]|nr:hypothetical protein [Caldisphaera sp.]PMP89507.1 MAG: hypothetical protein C0171_07015 [Caldisphaera sp.]
MVIETPRNIINEISKNLTNSYKLNLVENENLLFYKIAIKKKIYKFSSFDSEKSYVKVGFFGNYLGKILKVLLTNNSLIIDRNNLKWISKRQI